MSNPAIIVLKAIFIFAVVLLIIDKVIGQGPKPDKTYGYWSDGKLVNELEYVNIIEPLLIAMKETPRDLSKIYLLKAKEVQYAQSNHGLYAYYWKNKLEPLTLDETTSYLLYYYLAVKEVPPLPFPSGDRIVTVRPAIDPDLTLYTTNFK